MGTLWSGLEELPDHRTPVSEMIAFVDTHRAAHGVEPICKGLPIAPSTYRPHAARRADPSKGSGLIHHSDRGSQYVAIRYTERLTDADVEPSVGSVGDSYDNALAEMINGLYKTEVIRCRGP